jgi:malonate transporter
MPLPSAAILGRSLLCQACGHAAAAPPVNYAQLLIPDFSLILIGYLLCRYTPMNREVWVAVEKLVYYVLFPVLLFQSVLRSRIDLSATSGLMLAGLVLAVVAIALSYSVPHWPGLGRHIDRREHAGAAQVAFRFNSFIALALAERLGGAAGLLGVAVLIGVCVPIMNIAAVWPMARGAGNSFGRELLRNPLIVATASGLVANLAGLSIPGWMEPTTSRIAAASLALGLMAAGAGMQFGPLARAKVLAVALLGIRHLLLPLVALVLVRWFQLSPVHATVLMIFSALPTASTCYVLAARMGYNGPYVAGLVTLSTLLGMLSLPFALGVLR